jgi:hypothetical protein
MSYLSGFEQTNAVRMMLSSEDECSQQCSMQKVPISAHAIHAYRVTPLGTFAVADRGDFAGI